MSDEFIFKNNDKVGAADAKTDKQTLLATFIDTGDYSAIKDFDRPERYILGRAGSGKTALITRLEDESDDVISIEPESLSLGYISNSTIIQSLTILGVDFTLFYRMLWRHVLVVEILKHHFGIVDENTQLNVMDKLKLKFSRSKHGKVHERALKYLEKWGSSFWKDTDHRIKELKETLESNLKSEVGSDISKVGFAKLSGGANKKQEKTIEVAHKAQEVVYSVQMKELSDLMKMLDDAIDDKQKRYYLLIDRLDEDWVDEGVRYSLIKALLDTVKDFEIVKQVKPLIVLRSDLIARVYDQTKTTGFQEEKFNSLNLHISWTREDLLTMLDKRVDFLVKKRYTKGKVSYKDLLPKEINGQDISDYLVSRTLLRPRDMIDLFNECIDAAVGSPIISEVMVNKAERDYSRQRKSAIHDEWRSTYSTLDKWEKLLDGREPEFLLGDLSANEIEAIALVYEMPLSDDYKECVLAKAVSTFLESNISLEELRKRVAIAFYTVGYIGIQLNNGITYWVNETKKALKPDELTEETIIEVHPMFYSCFNIKVSK